MATYAQWLQHADKGNIKRVTWVCGRARVWVEELIDNIRDQLKVSEMNYSSFIVGVHDIADIWAATTQYPLDPNANRLIVIRDAHLIKKWNKLEEWIENSRLLLNVYLVFVSNDEEFSTTEKNGTLGPMRPHVAMIKNASMGHIVRCKVSADKDMKDVIDWVQRKLPVDEKMARYILTYLDADLKAVANLCNKLRLCGLMNPDEKLIQEFCDYTPLDDLADYLIINNKRAALSRIEDLKDNDYGRVIGSLDARLELMADLNSYVRQRMTDQEIREKLGKKGFLLEKFKDSAKYYDARRVSQCRQYMAIVDGSIRTGAREGTLELLISLW